MTALSGVRADIRRIPLENIAGLAKDRFGDASIIPLWFGEGDVPAPAFIGEAMSRAIAAGQVFYTHQNGIPELRQTLADYLTGLGQQPIGPERITVTFSGMNAIQLAIQLVCQPGDNVVAIDPVWPNSGGMARLVGAEVRSARNGPRPERLGAGSADGGRPDRRSHARRVLRLARQPHRRDDPDRDAEGAA